MEIRLAVREELASLREMYSRLRGYMEEQGIRIWDDVYPCELLEEDIAQRRLFVLMEDGKPAGAFALCTSSGGADRVEWEQPGADAVYMERLGVAVEHLRKGYAGRLIARAVKAAEEMGADYLRLFAAACNEPSLKLYEKNGFQRAGGVFREEIDENWVLPEYGFEMKVKRP